MLWTAFFIGIFRVFFIVIGMCGPIALALAGKDKEQIPSLNNTPLQFRVGPLTYTVLGDW